MKTPKISIIVTAKNNGKYIKECLESCLNQTVKPHEVIYSDDCSTDNSLEIVSQLKDISIVENKTWVGVVKARNNGVKASTGEVLVHVDGDDKLPRNFLEKHLEVFDETTPFTYCAAQCFGTKSHFYPAPEWHSRSIFDRNYVNTSTMMWKWVFEKAGGWQETSLKTMWDWSLAIRASRMMDTPPKKSPAVLLYRQHEESWSIEKKKEIPDYNVQHQAIRKELTTMSICCIYGGRLPELMPIWIDRLIKDIQCLGNKPQLVIINNTSKPILWVTNYHEQFFSEIKIVKGFPPIKAENEMARRKAVSSLLANCHNLASKYMTGDIIHYREDDMIPNTGCFQQLYEFIMDISGKPKKAVVSALYLNRHHPQVVGGQFNYETPHLTREPKQMKGSKPVSVDFTGTGCLLYWKNLTPSIWYPIAGTNICAHDWRFGLDTKALGRDLYILPTAICKHIIELKWNFVEPNETEDVSPLNYSRKSC